MPSDTGRQGVAILTSYVWLLDVPLHACLGLLWLKTTVWIPFSADREPTGYSVAESRLLIVRLEIAALRHSSSPPSTPREGRLVDKQSHALVESTGASYERIERVRFGLRLVPSSLLIQ